MLTEQQVERSFRKLFQDPDFSLDAIQKADSLITQLRWESPLRHRLGDELDELPAVDSPSHGHGSAASASVTRNDARRTFEIAAQITMHPGWASVAWSGRSAAR